MSKAKEHIESAAAWTDTAKQGLQELLAEINKNPFLANFAYGALSKLEQGIAGAEGNLDEARDELIITESQSNPNIQELKQA